MAPQSTNDSDAVADALDQLAVGDAVRWFDRHFMARAQAQNEALLRQVVDGCRRHINRGYTADKHTADVGAMY